jgi:hypothetical protein
LGNQPVPNWEILQLRESFSNAPRELRTTALSRLPRIDAPLAEHPQVRDEFRELR